MKHGDKITRPDGIYIAHKSLLIKGDFWGFKKCQSCALTCKNNHGPACKGIVWMRQIDFIALRLTK